MPTIKIFERLSGKELKFELEDDVATVEQVKQRITDLYGVPGEYQQIYHEDKELSNDERFPVLGADPYSENTADITYSLDGGSSFKIDTGRFELKIRCACWTVCALDDQWERCQLFCIHCQCSVM